MTGTLAMDHSEAVLLQGPRGRAMQEAGAEPVADVMSEGAPMGGTASVNKGSF